MGSIGLHVTGGQRGDICRPRARMERPFPCTVVCRFDPPAEGRAAAGRFDVADSYAPCWWDPRSDPRQGTLPDPGPAAGPATGQDPAGAG